jgi:hypothetical protein
MTWFSISPKWSNVFAEVAVIANRLSRKHLNHSVKSGFPDIGREQSSAHFGLQVCRVRADDSNHCSFPSCFAPAHHESRNQIMHREPKLPKLREFAAMTGGYIKHFSITFGTNDRFHHFSLHYLS